MSSRRAYIILTILLKEEKGTWTAECKELGTATFGETFEEAKANIKEAVDLHLNTLEDVGECTRFLKEKKVPIKYSEPPRQVTFTMPLEPNVFIQKDLHELPIACAV
jgi:predicted RNase H-like HicB family nuclease